MGERCEGTGGEITHLKKSIVVLLILLISVPLLAGIAHSASPPTIYATGGSGNSVLVQGISWTPSAGVAIYWDTEDANHKVAQVMTDYGGSFYVNFPLENQIVGVHTVVAVQGSRRATTTFNVGTTSPPDDRLLNPINSINNFLQNNIGSKLTSIDTAVANLKPASLLIGKFISLPIHTGYTIDLLPTETGKTYSGHISIIVRPSHDTGQGLFFAVLEAKLPTYNNTYGPISSGGSDFDFACQGLSLFIRNNQNVDVQVGISAVMQYQNSTDVNTLP